METGRNGRAGLSVIIIMVKEHQNESGNVPIQVQVMEEPTVQVTALQVQRVKYAIVSKISFLI